MTDNTNKLNADVEVLYLEIEEREREIIEMERRRVESSD